MLRRLVPLLFLALTVLPNTASATTVRLVNLHEMSRQSAFIFHGTVTAVETLNLGTRDRPKIVTDVTFPSTACSKEPPRDRPSPCG